jgi:hypothetical protein
MRVDFQAIKDRVSMASVVGHYQIELRKNRGTCPSKRSRTVQPVQPA